MTDLDRIVFLDDFVYAARPQEKLRAALCLWASGMPDSGQRENCRKYLRSRIRPAVQALIRTGDVLWIDELAFSGLFGLREIPGFLDEALKAGQPEAAMYLLHLQKAMRSGMASLFHSAEGRSGAEKTDPKVMYCLLTEILELPLSDEIRDVLAGLGRCPSGTGGASGGRKAGRRGDSAGTGMDRILPEELTGQRMNAPRFDYHRYLSRFMEPGEEMEMDPDSFDYGYYMMGLDLPDRIPMTEPLEYREVKRLQELVIAIDTSASCSLDTVKRFLEETWSIFENHENFFSHVNVYLIQCDVVVQRTDILHNREDWDRYMQDIRIEGRSGTDFRPVFRYVEAERRSGRLKNLRALLYFTDGDGIYPERATDYETVFVFLEKTEHMKNVPPWAGTLIAGSL